MNRDRAPILSLTLQQIAHAMGGKVEGDSVRCPGPGHSNADDSLKITPSESAPDGFIVYSHANDDPMICRDYTRGRCGIAAWEPKRPTNGNGHDIRAEKPKKRIVAIYDYDDALGVRQFQAVRFAPKGFSQRRPDGNGGWLYNLTGVNLVPYRLPELLEAIALDRRVYIVEGEKDADALHGLGIAATCNPMGAGKWRGRYSEHLRGADVTILPDNDVAGREHALAVMKSLDGIAASVRIVRLPDLPDKGDVSDWIAAGGTGAELERICEVSEDDPRDAYVDNARDAALKNGKNVAPGGEPRTLELTPFAFIDPRSIPSRPFIMGSSYIRKYVSAIVAPAGLGKSALGTVEALALVTGKKLLGIAPRKPRRVWYIGEDDKDELSRRFMAAAKAYGLCSGDIGNRLIVTSFRDMKICVAHKTASGATINETDVAAIIAAIRANNIDVIMVDPLVKTHRLVENDNMDMELVFEAWGRIADQGNCAVQTIIHARKGSMGQAKNIEDVRGGSSQLGALRDARLIVRMTDEEAAALGIDPKQASLHIRVGDAKANMAPASGDVSWMKLQSVFLDNASADLDADNDQQDNVQVVMPFRAPGLFEGVPWERIDDMMRAFASSPRRADARSVDWSGHLVGEFLGIDTTQKAGAAKAKAMLRAWIATGALISVREKDENRRDRPHISLGNWEFGGGRRP